MGKKLQWKSSFICVAAPHAIEAASLERRIRVRAFRVRAFIRGANSLGTDEQRFRSNRESSASQSPRSTQSQSPLPSEEGTFQKRFIDVCLRKGSRQGQNLGFTRSERRSNFTRSERRSNCASHAQSDLPRCHPRCGHPSTAARSITLPRGRTLSQSFDGPLPSEEGTKGVRTLT